MCVHVCGDRSILLLFFFPAILFIMLKILLEVAIFCSKFSDKLNIPIVLSIQFLYQALQ